jgi:hypothetical protein
MRLFLPLALVCAVLSGCRTNESPEAQVNDLEIVAQVKSKLASEIGATTVTNVTVDSTNGVVTLAGQVNTSDLKVRAETIAKAVPKVTKVVNNLQVVAKPPTQSSLNHLLCRRLIMRSSFFLPGMIS